MVKALIFDCFGVLVTDGLEAAMTERKIDARDKQKIVQLVTAVNKGSMTVDSYRDAVASILGVTTTEYAELVKK